MQKESIYDNMTRCEKEVANELKKLGIPCLYEQPVFVWDENKRPGVWAPDFFLIPFGIYVEVCGSKKFDYDYRMKIFGRNGYRVIFLHLYKENKKWTKYFIKYLEGITLCRNKKLNEILRKVD